MTNEADKLLPCPHCGGKAAYVPRAVNLALQKDPSDPKFGVSVICGTCSAETGNFIDEAAASLRWNRRACAAAPAAQPATPLREVLEQAIEALEVAHKVTPHGLEHSALDNAHNKYAAAIAALRSRLDGEKT